MLKSNIDSEWRERSMKKAKIGDLIEFKNGLQGIVDVVYERSVIVDLTHMNYHDEKGFEKTVVNHKNYKILQTVSKG